MRYCLPCKAVATLLTCRYSTTIDVSPFEQALKEFRSSLAPREQSLFTQCRSPEELITYVQSLEKLQDIQKRGALIMYLERFSKNLSHYFDVIGILVQSHPEYAALAWGAFRLVLQVGFSGASTLIQLYSFLAARKQFPRVFREARQNITTTFGAPAMA